MDESYKSIRDAASQTGYGVEYIRRLIRKGQVKAQKVSTRFYMVCVPDLEAHRANNREGINSRNENSKATVEQ